MLEIFQYLDWKKDQEASSLVCKRWLNLVRLSRKTIHIRFSDGTDALIKLLSDRFFNIRNVWVDENSLISPAPIYGRPSLINRFPLNEIWKSQLDEMRECRLSDAGLAAIGGGFTKLESLRLTLCNNVTDVGLISIVEKCKLLKSLDLQYCCVGDNSLAAIAKYCTRLEDLNLVCCKSLTDTGFVQLAHGCGRTLKSLRLEFGESLTNVSLEAVGFHCISLQILSIKSELINDEGLLSILKGCSLLKSVKLHCQNITDEALQAVGRFSLSLELLALHDCNKLTDKSLCAIGKGCKMLKSLSLVNCRALSDLGLDFVAVGCVELMCLEVRECYKIGIGGLKSVAKACTRLSKLVVQQGMYQQLDVDALSDSDISWKYLQSLHLISCSSIGDEALCGITRGCRNLKKLNIFDCPRVGNEGIVSIGWNCKFLTDLTISYCDQVGDAGIIAIARACPQLSFLDVTDAKKLGDEGMAAIGEGCPLLKDLKISGCQQITDMGLSYISRNCKLLESCNMMGCNGISITGVATFINSCPKIRSVSIEKFKFSQRTESRVRQRKISLWTKLRVRQRKFSSRTKPRGHPLLPWV
ncbi:unnamed protein product [Fraxinus pennsylvanica]|uniref:Uncharacterized protein n=1 Tax=Fraxinus pennsylvanica TaxID=56036 RepID=A0AAD2A171_9LAMI|nr:unnamed protein product [Fraxinus pennsylvanica]